MYYRHDKYNDKSIFFNSIPTLFLSDQNYGWYAQAFEWYYSKKPYLNDHLNNDHRNLNYHQHHHHYHQHNHFYEILIQSIFKLYYKVSQYLSLSAIVISIMLQDNDQGPVVKVRSLAPSSACVINTPLIFPSQYIIIFCNNTFFGYVYFKRYTNK